MKSHPFLDSLERMRRGLGTGPLACAMKELGSPEKRLRCVQVAGTNGKGSTAAMVANGLESCGLYTSPHLHELNERVMVGGKPISDGELNTYIEKVRPAAEAHGLSFFEALTAAALLYFAEKKCAYAVLEVGLGGRLDATSVANPVVSIITNIGFDHTHILGGTIAEIAREKAGVVRGNIVVTSETGSEALRVIEEKAALECATVIRARPRGFSLSMMGEHQQKNAACAYEALLALGKGPAEARKAVETAVWPGRLEQRGRFLFDCAHNEPAIKELAKHLSGKEFELVLAMKSDKSHEKMASLIVPPAKKVYATQFTEAPDSLPAKQLYGIVRRHNPCCELVESPGEALKKSRGFTVVTGSIFLVGELRRLT